MESRSCGSDRIHRHDNSLVSLIRVLVPSLCYLAQKGKYILQSESIAYPHRQSGGLVTSFIRSPSSSPRMVFVSVGNDVQVDHSDTVTQ